MNTMRIRFDKLSPMWKWLKNGAPTTAMRLRSAQRVTTHDDVLGDVCSTKVAQPPWGEDDARVSLTRLGRGHRLGYGISGLSARMTWRLCPGAGCR